MQERITQQEKLASLGAVTSGIADELRNPLNFVVNFSEILSDDLARLHVTDTGIVATSHGEVDDHRGAEALINESRDMVEKIRAHGRTAAGILDRMMEQVSSGRSPRKLVDIGDLITSATGSVCDVLAPQGAVAVTLLTTLDAEFGPVEVAPEDIRLVVEHVVRNAYQAVLDRQHRVNATRYEPRVVVATRGLDDQFEISVTDNGVGIEEADTTKIFTPFFTTRSPGEGVGLGLSSSHRLIQDHQGKITFTLTAGETTFRISLPNKPAAVAAQRA